MTSNDTLSLILYLSAALIAIGVPVIAYIIARKLRHAPKKSPVIRKAPEINKNWDNTINDVNALDYNSPNASAGN